MNRNRSHSRAVQMDRDILELEMVYQAEIEGYSADAMKAREAARAQARKEIYEQEAERRNEEEAKPIVGLFVQIGTVCLNFGGEHRTWKITDRCIFCGRILSICHWHHWNFSWGWIRSSQKAGPTPDVEALPELPPK